MMLRTVVRCVALASVVSVIWWGCAVKDQSQSGLASRYPDDEGLERDPAVLFSDDFESGAIRVFSQESAGEPQITEKHAWSRVIGTPRITDDPRHVHGGHRALDLTINGPAAIGLEKYFSAGHDRLFLRYYLKYDDAFPGTHHVGGMMSARAPWVAETAPGIKPDGTNKFDVSLDHWRMEPTSPPPGHLVAYVYHMDQQHEWGEDFSPSGKTSPGVNAARGIFGPSFLPRPDFVPPRGSWHCYELMVQANTPGRRDGRVAFWFDGRLAADFPSLRFRTTETLKINRAYVAMYESQTPGLRRIWVDDVVVATNYIGPKAH